MNISKRLFRKPFTTVLWLLVIILMTGFLTVGITLKYSSDKLADGLDKRNTAIAVRADPSSDYENGVITVSRRFTRADAEAIEALDSVKAVRNNSLAGASCPDLHPITETNRYMSWASFGDTRPYGNMLILGGMAEMDENNGKLLLDVRVNEIPMLFEEFSDLYSILMNMEWITVEMETDDVEAVKGFFNQYDEYVFCGMLDPARNNMNRYYRRYVLELGRVSVEDGYLVGRAPGFDAESIPEGCKYEPYSFPAAELINTAQDYEFVFGEREENENARDFDAFLNETGHDIWRDFREVWQKQQHSVPVIGVDRLESMFVFVNGEAEIVEGRSFAPEEYASGAHSLIISEKTAELGGLAVGDTISLSRFLCTGDAAHGTNPSTAAQTGAILSNPWVDLLDMNREYGPEEEFEIVGVYRLAGDWSGGTYSITPNTLFIPRSAQLEGAFGTIPPAEADPGDTTDIYGLYLSAELYNGRTEDFRLQISGTPYAGQFYVFDQGFETVQKNLNVLARTSNRLMWIAAAGWLLLFAMFLLMYQGGQKRNIGTMRSLGRTPGQTARYLIISGLIVAILGVLIGTAAGRVVLDSVQSRIVEETIAGVDFESEKASAMTEEEFTEFVTDSMPGADLQVKLGAAQICVMGVIMAAQAAVICRREPRELMDS